MKSDSKCKGKRYVVKLHRKDKYIYMDKHSANANDRSINICYSGKWNESNL